VPDREKNGNGTGQNKVVDRIVQSKVNNNNKQQHSLFSQASWGRLEMKPERNKFKVQAH